VDSTGPDRPATTMGQRTQVDRTLLIADGRHRELRDGAPARHVTPVEELLAVVQRGRTLSEGGGIGASPSYQRYSKANARGLWPHCEPPIEPQGERHLSSQAPWR
jgi:hypothetical protein